MARLGIIMPSEKLPVQFPVRAHALVAGSVPSWGTYRRQPIDTSLSLSLSLSPSPPSPSLSLSLKSKLKK